MTNDIDEFRKNIRQRLKDVKGTIGTDITLYHTKHNEDLEHYLQESNLHNTLDPRLYDLILQIANHGFICGINSGLHIGNQKIESINSEIEDLKTKISNSDLSKDVCVDYLIHSVTNDMDYQNLMSGIIFIMCCLILGVCIFT